MKKLLLTFLGFVVVIWATIFFFIPAFSGKITVSPGFETAGITIHYYGILMAVAILAAFIVAAKLAPRYGLSALHVEGGLPRMIIFGFLGARIYFVVFAWQYFGSHLGDIPQIWKGGFSIYGAIIGAAIGLVLYARKNSLPAGKLFDLAALAAPLAQAIGRFGNFFNQEAFGYPTGMPWKLYISPANRPKEYLTERYFHPTFLYEAIWNILVFAILLWLFRKRSQDASGGSQSGQMLGAYLILYSIGRFFIEGIRLDSFMVGSIRADQATALLMCALGLGIIIYYAYDRQKQDS